MEKKKNQDVSKIIDNIRKIMIEKNLTQATIAEFAETTPSQISKIFKGDVQLSIIQLSNIATKLNISVVDIFTYPEKYLPKIQQSEDLKATLTIELKKETKDKVLKIVFGNENFKILNE